MLCCTVNCGPNWRLIRMPTSTHTARAAPVLGIGMWSTRAASGCRSMAGRWPSSPSSRACLSSGTRRLARDALPAAYDRRPALEAFILDRHVGGGWRDLPIVLLGTGDGANRRSSASTGGRSPPGSTRTRTDVGATFARYVAETGRDRYVHERDPLHRGPVRFTFDPCGLHSWPISTATCPRWKR